MTSNIMKCLSPILLLVIFLSCTAHVRAQERFLPEKPNIIIILADDMGYSDPGCFGGEIETPNIDKLAEGGLRFTNFYNSGRCWPTRSSLLSGYYANAIGMDPVNREEPCPSWVKTLPRYLSDAGYRTYHSGKYHFQNNKPPVKAGGFDQSYWIERGTSLLPAFADDVTNKALRMGKWKIVASGTDDHGWELYDL